MVARDAARVASRTRAGAQTYLAGCLLHIPQFAAEAQVLQPGPAGAASLSRLHLQSHFLPATCNSGKEGYPGRHVPEAATPGPRARSASAGAARKRTARQAVLPFQELDEFHARTCTTDPKL